MHTNTIVIGVMALVVGAGIGYVAHPTAATTAPQSMRGNFAGGVGQTRGNFSGMLSGTVATKDASNITLNTRDGSSHVVLLSPSTTVSKSVNGTINDVAVGSTIIVSGSNNSDGSVSATMLQLRPAMPSAPAAQ